MRTYKTDFTLEGRFLGFVFKDGDKLKALKLATANGEWLIKLSKELRLSLCLPSTKTIASPTLAPGAWIQVSGLQKLDLKKGIVRLKGYQLSLATVGSHAGSSPVTPCSSACSAPCQAIANSLTDPVEAQPAKKETILVCQKSDCCKKGGNQISETLKAILRDRQLMDRITIKGTGCMKRCKDGPNIVMPDKTRYSRIRPDAIEAIVDKHFQAS